MIDEQLLVRIKRIHEAYDYHHGLQDAVAIINASPQAKAKKAKSWQELLKEDDSDGGGGGGSTAKGLRGKNAVNAVQAAKAEMKRLGRR